MAINTLNAELNPICYLLALLGVRPIFHVSMIRVKIWGELCVTTQVVTGASEWQCPEGEDMIL
jgi:hypothetical protein